MQNKGSQNIHKARETQWADSTIRHRWQQETCKSNQIQLDRSSVSHRANKERQAHTTPKEGKDQQI